MGHFRERKIKGEARFSAEILAQTILMQRIAAASSAGVIKRLPKVVAAEKPLKTTARRAAPVFVPRKRVGFEAGGNHGMSFQRLLVESRSLAAA